MMIPVAAIDSKVLDVHDGSHVKVANANTARLSATKTMNDNGLKILSIWCRTLV